MVHVTIRMKQYVDAFKVKTMPRERLWFPMQSFITSHPFTFRRGQLRQPDSRSANFHYNNYPSSVRELPLPAPQLLSEQESGQEGGRKVYVNLTTFVGPDRELYMTEYAAIRIVFTLQGLYTCTHSPRIQLASNSDYLRGTSQRN